jgi:hypothetical protein
VFPSGVEGPEEPLRLAVPSWRGGAARGADVAGAKLGEGVGVVRVHQGAAGRLVTDLLVLGAQTVQHTNRLGVLGPLGVLSLATSVFVCVYVLLPKSGFVFSPLAVLEKALNSLRRSLDGRCRGWS